MAERMGRVGRGRYDEDPRGSGSDPDPRRGPPGVRGLQGLLLILASGAILYAAWWIMWERSHPAASAARRLEQGDAAARMEALTELGSLGPHDPEVAVPALIAALSDPVPSNRAKAADDLSVAILGHWTTGPGPDEIRDALFSLMRLFRDPDAAVRGRAAHALAAVVDAWQGSPGAMGFGAVEDELTRMAGATEPGMRAGALLALSTMALRAHEPPPPRLVAALDDPAAEVRAVAARGLLAFVEEVIPRVPALVEAMTAARPECRPAYFEVFWGFRPSRFRQKLPAETVPALIAAMGIGDLRARGQVAALLGEFGPDARSALPDLLTLVEAPGEPGMPGSGLQAYCESISKYEDPAIAAARAIRWIAGGGGPSRPAADPKVAAALMKLMASPVPFRRLAAIKALEGFAADERILSALLAATQDADETVRSQALRALRGRGERLAARALETIRPALEDRSPEVRGAAAYALEGFGPGIEPMVPALLRHAEDDPDPEVRSTCATALGLIGPGDVSPAVIPALIAAIDRPGSPSALREHLIEALARFGARARPAVPAIARALLAAEREADRPTRGVAASPHGERFFRTATEERVALRRNAARALGVLAPGTPTAGEAVGALTTALDDPIDDVERVVAEALTSFGAAARPAVPALAAAFHRSQAESNALRAGLLAEAIGRIDPTAPEAAESIAFLIAFLRTDDGPARLFAEHALSYFGPAAAAAVPDLVELAGRPTIRMGPELESVAWTLGRIAPDGPGAAAAVAAMVEVLRDEPRSSGVGAVIESLSRFGAAAAPALPRLRELEGSGEPGVGPAAHKAAVAIAGLAR